MFILFDIGGSHTYISISKFGDSIDQTEHFPTPLSYVDAMALFKNTVDKLTGGKAVEFAVGGIAGVLNSAHTKLIHSPHLPGWEKENLSSDISRLLGARVHIENDSDLAALGEATYGAGIDYDIVAYMSISTGIGGGIVIEKQIVPHNGSFEPGYQMIDIQGLKTLEDYVSGDALKSRYAQNPEEIDDESTWKDMAHILAVGVANSVRHWGPDIMILGGGVMNNIPIQEVEKTTHELLHSKTTPIIVRSSMKESTLYGALYLTHNIK